MASDRKLTDNEIIKALECCINNGDCRECALNPKKGNYGYCTGLAIKSALDLINRQKAEIERLKANEEMAEGYADALVEYTKAEAYKEFAELSIKRICERVSAPIPSESYIVERCNQEIDNLLKELEGEHEKAEK